MVRSSKQTALLACRNRSPIRFSVLTETNRGTGSVRTDKRTRGPTEPIYLPTNTKHPERWQITKPILNDI